MFEKLFGRKPVDFDLSESGPVAENPVESNEPRPEGPGRYQVKIISRYSTASSSYPWRVTWEVYDLDSKADAKSRARPIHSAQAIDDTEDGAIRYAKSAAKRWVEARKKEDRGENVQTFYLD